MKKEDIRIVARVTQKEKERINSIAERCGLSTTEYIRQRALNYEPTPFPTDAYFKLCEKVDSLIENPESPRFKREVIDCLNLISLEIGR
jgi:AraC-like DNA-binding protein